MRLLILSLMTAFFIQLMCCSCIPSQWRHEKNVNLVFLAVKRQMHVSQTVSKGRIVPIAKKVLIAQVVNVR